MGRTPMPQATRQPVWHLIDAEGLVLGRMAAHVARLLRGKHNPSFTPHYACGDKVIVINAEKVALSGKKMDTMLFHWHTGYPGGLKVRKAQDILEGKRPERLVIKAVERMMKHGPLGRRLMKNLYVYTGENHPHQEAKPQIIDMRALNNKNAKRSLRVS
ncbi:MAG: 50S ribosomal protein L13 [Alphaproteobacteria bacterium GM202ARS2]|nr:50S ribosomal protein L13 [Alphaproteobacteria bacterium GM202ARS2]